MPLRETEHSEGREMEHSEVHSELEQRTRELEPGHELAQQSEPQQLLDSDWPFLVRWFLPGL